MADSSPSPYPGETGSKIQLNDIYKSFGRNHVLKGINLSIYEGESAAIIGESGGGKSIMVRIMLGLLKPDSGSILFDGASLSSSRKEFMANVGMLFQGGALFDSLPVWRNVAFRLLRGSNTVSVREARCIATRKLERVGLDAQVADLYPAELSGGMMKRVGLARAIAANPKYLFFDEPTTGLDPIRAANISRLIRELVDEHKATALVISHDMPCVRAISDRIHFLHDGKVNWSGNLSELGKLTAGRLHRFVNGLPSCSGSHEAESGINS